VNVRPFWRLWVSVTTKVAKSVASLPELGLPYTSLFVQQLVTNVCILLLNLSCSSFPQQTLQSVADLGFHCIPSQFLPPSGHYMPISYSHYLQILFNLISPLFPWLSPFSYYFYSICLDILSLFVLSICPDHLNPSFSIYLIMSVPCNISCISLFVLILQLSSSFLRPSVFLVFMLFEVVLKLQFQRPYAQHSHQLPWWTVTSLRLFLLFCVAFP
jgi:hypothetical protein